MNTLQPPISILLTLALLPAGAGPAAAGDETTSTAYREVLNQPDRLAPQPDGDGALMWVDPKTDFGAYDALLIEHIRVRLADGAENQDVDPTELKTLTDYLHDSIVKALTPAYRIATKPGPGVLRTRIWITELVPTKTKYSVATLIIPYASVFDIASGAATGKSLGEAPYLGRTGIAGELVDSTSGQVVAAYADGEVGRKYVVDVSEGVVGAVGEGIDGYLDAYGSWNYAKDAFDGWAKSLRHWLDGVTKR